MTDETCIKYWSEFRDECNIMLKLGKSSKKAAKEQIPMVDTVLESFNIIEAQQQEIEQLKKENNKLHCQDCAAQAFEVACVLQDYKEKNEHLLAQNDIMREALKLIDKCGGEWESGIACEALSGEFEPVNLNDIELGKLEILHNLADARLCLTCSYEPSTCCGNVIEFDNDNNAIKCVGYNNLISAIDYHNRRKD